MNRHTVGVCNFFVLIFLFELQSPPPLCPWFHFIDKEQPEWARREIEERHKAAWDRFFEEERREEAKKFREEAEAKVKAERERMQAERRAAREATELKEKEALEADMQRKREHARQAQAAEEARCSKGKWPRWTQD